MPKIPPSQDPGKTAPNKAVNNLENLSGNFQISAPKPKLRICFEVSSVF